MPEIASLALAVETAGSACSVAIAQGDRVIAAERREMRHGHGEALMPMVDAVAVRAGIAPASLDFVAVSLGPGGFTGIRVGLAAARGLALASGARLVGVSSFAAVAALHPPREGVLLVALDSRRSDLYVELRDRRGGRLAPPAAILSDELPRWLAAIIADAPLTIAGDAAAAAAAALPGRAVVALVPDTAPDARGVLAAMRNGLAEPSEAAVAPLYLRPPDVSFPKHATAGVRPGL